ncbi:MAG TPA: RNA polymerase sigma factor [Anaerolineales bacterium]|nr:RNA polymerase sigma factor [Anaerolineales bacterium]
MSDSRAGQPLNEVERQTFHELYQTHRQRVYSICIRMTADPAEAEDLTQDVFLHLFRTIGSFRGESAFTTWLHRLTVNIVLMHFRRRKRCRESISDTEELPFYAQTDTFDPMGMRIVDGILLSEVIAKLPNGYRQALVMHDIEGLEHNEIAAKRGRSQGTSKSQLHKARIMLRQLITQTKPTRHVQYD